MRYHFAQRMLSQNKSNLKNIIFSDESRFCNSPDNLMIWRRKDDYSDETTIEFSKKFIQTMAWAAIGYNFKTDLYFHR